MARALCEFLLEVMGSVRVAVPGHLYGPPLSRPLLPAPSSAQPALGDWITCVCELVSPLLESCKDTEQSPSLVPLETEPIDPTK